MIQKDKGTCMAGVLPSRTRDVFLQIAQGKRRNRHAPLLIAFAIERNDARLFVNRSQAEIHEFADTQTRGVHGFKHGAVADTGFFGKIGPFKKRVDLFDGKNDRKFLG